MEALKHAINEKRSEHIKGEERQMLYTYFASNDIKPSTVFHGKVAQRSTEALASGNRTGVGVTRSVLQKVASEGRKNQKNAR